MSLFMSHHPSAACGMSTCDSSLCPLLFGVNSHNVSSKSAIGVQPIISPNFWETQVSKKEDYKVSHLAAASINIISRGRDLLRFQRKRQGVRTLPVSPWILTITRLKSGISGTRGCLPSYSLLNSKTIQQWTTLFLNRDYITSTDKRKLVATLPQLPSAQCEQGLYRPTWLITMMMMTFVAIWRHISRLLGLSRRP